MEQGIVAALIALVCAYCWLRLRRRPMTLEEQWRVLREWGARTSTEINTQAVTERR